LQRTSTGNTLGSSYSLPWYQSVTCGLLLRFTFRKDVLITLLFVVQRPAGEEKNYEEKQPRLGDCRC
jgi:hypothetical protein